ncbi:MAG: CotH kinase family protein, partial [Flavobacteriales bacterium]
NWWRDMGWYTTKTKYCEVILNGQYQGVYILMEQIKWDNDRVDVEKMNMDDNVGDSLTGGYIFKVDKTTGSGQYDWESHVDEFQGATKLTLFQYDYPNRDAITHQQENYLQQFVYDWEQALIDPTYTNAETGYRKYADVNSFIDFFILQELTKNVDGYRLSTYLNKQRDSRGGKLQVGPAWDFNIALGNADYCDGGETEGWALEFVCDPKVIPFWWERMNQDPVYWNQLQCRWAELRSGLLSWESINSQIDENVGLLGDATGRNFDQWNILGTQIWPNNYVGGTYTAEIFYLKQWLGNRIAWLDANIGSPTSDCASSYSDEITISEINYNSHDTIATDDWFELQNLTSEAIDLSFWTVYDGNEFNTYTFPMGTQILPDSFLVVTENDADFAAVNAAVTNRIGSFNWGIGNGGDEITIRDFNNDFVVSVDFDDDAPWPTAPDGNSQTLEKWDWATNLNDPASWHEGCPGGSPGRAFTYCVYVGVNEVETSSVSIYPNPAKDMVWVALSQPSTVSVYSVSGQKLLSEKLQDGRSQINVSDLSAGLYLVEISAENSNQRITQKLIIE